MFHVFPHALEQIPPPSFSLEESVALLLIALMFAILIAIAPIPLVGPSAIPRKFKAILARAALRIVDANHHRPSIARRANQLHSSSPIDCAELEPGGIR